MAKSIKKAKNKVISKKSAPKMLGDAVKSTPLNSDTLISQLGANFGKVYATRNKKNPWRADSADGLNISFGQSKEEALSNLLSGINNRTK